LMHSKIILFGHGNSLHICNFLVDLHLKNEFVESAFQIFRNMSVRDSATWVAMISGLSQTGHEVEAINLYSEMRRLGAFPTPYVFSSVISACSKMNLYDPGEQLHASILKWGFSSDIYVCNSLSTLYTRSGRLSFAEKIFIEMQCKDEVTYNALISGFSMQGLFLKSFQIFQEMQSLFLKPSVVTIATLLGSCASTGAVCKGLQLHSYAVKAGMCSDVIVEGSLLDLYVKCHDIESARKFFLETGSDNVVLWNVMLVAYGQMGDLSESFNVFSQMKISGFHPNQYTYPSILRTCTYLGLLFQGQQVHAQVVKAGFDSNVYVCSVLIDMYAKLGKLGTALRIFRCYNEDDVVSWTAMIAGYAQHEMFTEALKLFVELQGRRIKLDKIVLASAISACAGIQGLELGSQIHGHSTVHGFSSDISIGNALVSLYARCALVKEAYSAFEKLHEKDHVSWNGLISGFGQSGKCEEALKVFSQMIHFGEEADVFTYGSSISAAANTTNSKLGKKIHARTLKTGYDSEVEVCNALITFYAKCGWIDDGRRVFINMAIKNEVSWNAMITGYSQHGYGHRAVELFEEMKVSSKVSPNHITYVGILTACSHVGMTEEGMRYFTSMSEHHGLLPTEEHYACVVDILGRSGQLHRARSFLESMPMEPSPMAWRALLSACTLHKNLEIGEFAAKHLIELEPKDSAAYVLMSNLYSLTSKRDEARRLMRDRGVKKEPGQSWIEVKNSVHAFFVGDRMHPLAGEIYEYLEDLNMKVIAIGYRKDSGSYDEEEEEVGKRKNAAVHSEKLAVSFGLVSLARIIPLLVIKNLRVCRDCHDWIRLVTKVEDRSIVVRDTYRFHHFQDGMCSCKDYW
ncbi:hypothetical protein M569_11356, partial [Genlisea aurea]